jgi:hypothetical protein
MEFISTCTTRALKRRLRTVEHKLKNTRKLLALNYKKEEDCCTEWGSAVILRERCRVRKQMAKLQSEAEDLKLSLLERGIVRMRVTPRQYKYTKLREDEE